MARTERIEAAMRRVTGQMVEALEAGLADPAGWTPPWHTEGFFAAAVNAATGRQYRGGNAVTLAVLEWAGPLQGPWATYRQWQGLGAQVRAGEKAAASILIPKPYSLTEEDGTERRGIRWGAAAVFAASQVDGWARPEPGPGLDEAARIEAGEAWFAGFCQRARVVTHQQPAAWYDPAADEVRLPPWESFTSALGFYATALHEAAHWTGHPARLGRGPGQPFGSPGYAREELVAELSAAMTGQELGLATELREDHRDYLAHWLRLLRDDPDALWQASTDAAKAAELVLDHPAQAAAA